MIIFEFRVAPVPGFRDNAINAINQIFVVFLNALLREGDFERSA
jgi:hypothetical protein